MLLKIGILYLTNNIDEKKVNCSNQGKVKNKYEEFILDLRCFFHMLWSCMVMKLGGYSI